jgi:hypothetical protein
MKQLRASGSRCGCGGLGRDCGLCVAAVQISEIGTGRVPRPSGCLIKTRNVATGPTTQNIYMDINIFLQEKAVEATKQK